MLISKPSSIVDSAVDKSGKVSKSGKDEINASIGSRCSDPKIEKVTASLQVGLLLEDHKKPLDPKLNPRSYE
jgi:hypothetical protein